MEYLIAFGSTHRALKAEAVLKKNSVGFKLLPAPKALEPYCDLVISVQGEDLLPAKDALAVSGVRIRSIYKKEESGYVKV